MFGEEWVSFATRSGARSLAREGDAMCERPLMARDISGTEPEVRSWISSAQIPKSRTIFYTFLIKFVVNINTSVSILKLCTAAK